MKQANHSRLEKLTLYAPMLLYFAFMLVLLILRSYPVYWLTGDDYYNPVYPTRIFNLVPFKTIAIYLSGERKSYLDVFGNIAIFIPMGIYCQLLNKRRNLGLAFAALLGIILFVETSQYVLSTGAFDVDDILLNAIGGAVGIAVYYAIFLLCKRNANDARDIVAMASILVVPILVFLVVQYQNWHHPIRYGMGSAIAILAWDALMYMLYRRKESQIKRLYLIFSAVFLLLYLFIALPQVGPSHF